MEVLRNTTQIYNALETLFGIEAHNFGNEDFISKPVQAEFLLFITQNITNKKLQQESLDNLINLVFQLNDYVEALGNLTKVFLASKQYEAIFSVVNKIFVAHIGTITYKSSTSLMFHERNFDRFVEIVKNCNISNQQVIPFIVEIYKSEQNCNYFVWKRPALEYLQNFWNINEQWFLNFINEHPNFRYKTLGAILEFNTTKGVEYLINDFINNSNIVLEENLSLIKHFKREVLHYIDREIMKAEPIRQKKFLEILLSMDNDTEVSARIQDFFQTTKNIELKNFLSSKISTNEKFNLKTEKQFLNASRNNVEKVNERVYNLPFEKFDIKFASGNKLNNMGYTYLIQIFKQEKNLNNLIKLKALENIFDISTFEDFTQKLFNYSSTLDDILETKWVWRFVCLFATQSLENDLIALLEFLYKENRTKEANYLSNCLIACKRISQDDIFDFAIPSVMTDEEIEIHKTKLFNDFIAGRFYNINTFNRLFISNPIYNNFAQTLIFGEYKFGRLVNAFHIIGTNKSFLIGSSIISDEKEKNVDIKIGIIHTLDCDSKFEKIFRFFQKPLFNQFKKANFNVNDYNSTSVCFNRFTGIVSTSEKFFDILLKNNFVKNKTEEENEFKSLIHIFETGNLICEIEFEKNITEKTPYFTVSGVYFYKLNETLQAKGKYLTKKSNAIPIVYLPYRYFDYIGSIILEAINT